MSDCGVCVYSGCDEYADLFISSIVTARKEHRCEECRRPILKGSKYEQLDMVQDGEWFHFKTCMICKEIGEAFCCDGRPIGYLWEGMCEVRRELTVSCFNRLKTPEAKAYLQQKWMQWKGLSA